jgi:ABC-2 type transport system ATP-binding protein
VAQQAPTDTESLSDTALDIRGLSKTFDKPAVDGLDLTVRAGEFYALLGPNGAGKTTTLRIVAGLLRPEVGSVSVFGIDALADPVAAKRVIAWVPDEPLIYEKLTPFEYLEFIAGLWGIDAATAGKRAAELIARLGLEAQAHERCQGFSKGMRQKVALAGALVHDPRLLILDGVTVIMTTHILEVAERMAERIGVIDRGRLIAEGTLAELRAQLGHDGTSLEEVFLDLVARQGEAA